MDSTDDYKDRVDKAKAKAEDRTVRFENLDGLAQAADNLKHIKEKYAVDGRKVVEGDAG